MKKKISFIILLAFHIVGKAQDPSLYHETNFVICNQSSLDLLVTDTSFSRATNISYEIKWGDGTNDIYNNSQYGNHSHTYPNEGYYSLLYIVTSLTGSKDSSSYKVFFGSNPAIPYYNPGQSTNVCLPFTIIIPKDTMIYNTPGTMFLFSSNDGTSIDTLYEPLSSNYSHTFINSSCGYNWFNGNNSFYIKITGINACETIGTTSIIYPITTITKPIANFAISPDSFCFTNTLLTFTNTSIKGIKGSNCDSTNQVKWSISPGVLGVDYTINFGSLNTYGTGTSPLGVTFLTIGNYNIKLVTKFTGFISGICNNDSITKTVYTIPDRNVGINILNPQYNLHIKDVMKLEPRNAPPGNPTKGVVYFDGVLNILRVFDGNTWKNCW